MHSTIIVLDDANIYGFLVSHVVQQTEKLYFAEIDNNCRMELQSGFIVLAVTK